MECTKRCIRVCIYPIVLNDEGENYDGGSNAAVSILNVVNEEYTGVIYVNCSLAFYAPKKSTIVDQRIHPTVMNMNTDFINHTTTASPWPLLSVNTNTMQNHTIKQSDLPLALRQSENMGKIYIWICMRLVTNVRNFIIPICQQQIYHLHCHHHAKVVQYDYFKYT